MDTSKWQWFKLSDKRLFPNIEKCKCSNATELLNKGDDIAYIGAKKRENGIMAYVQYDSSLSTNGNCIVFIGDGQGSVGYSLYQPREFIGSTTLIAGFNKKLNKYNALFIVSVLDLERYRYSFGRKYNKKAISNTYIKLPVDDAGNPNWQFMESFVKEKLIPKLSKRACSVWVNNPNRFPNTPKEIKLSDRLWLWFEFGSLINEPTKGAAYSDYELNECDVNDENRINYITRTNTNNGCKSIVVNEDYSGLEQGNAITIGDTTATIYYQPKPFICGDHMVIIRAPWLNKYTGTFVISILKREAYRYNYGRAFIIEKIKKTTVKLPVDTSGKPDWQFMEDYIKSLPYSANL